MTTLARPTLAAAALATAAALSLTACSSSARTAAASDAQATPVANGVSINLSPDQNRFSTPAVAAIASELPQAIRQRGTLEIADSSGGAAPLVFYATDNKTQIGVETDIASAVADVLGLKPHYNAVAWAQIFVGLDSGKYDVAFSNVTDTELRKQKYDFATYRFDNIAFEAKKGSTWKVAGPDDVAGRTIGVDSGTNQEKILLDWSAQDVKKGLKPVTVKYFTTPSDYYLALASGRIDAYFGPNPTAQYHANVSGQTQVVGVFSGAGSTLQGKIAATTRKGDGLVKPLNEALNELIRNGTYGKILARWGLSSEAVASSQINPPGLPNTGS
ncbi:polar amino acid transport system substrate-binding protein [Streptacidiphilus sp. MAP12-16]|uniref:ABC transporter substrate-binding protein n=1 Tax=Streptacidiphilus sp. MAP12-16 TaxID=3156300 RepID=UPI00351465D5